MIFLRKTFLLSFFVLLSSHAFAHLTSSELGVVEFIEQSGPQQLQLLEELVTINSGTDNPEGVRKVGEILKTQFEALGFQLQWHELPFNMRHAGSLIATHRGAPGKQILLIAHLDTVFSAHDVFQKFSLSADGKTAMGPGVIDNKGGLVTILYALKALHSVGELKKANITVFLCGDEELSAKPTSVSRASLVEVAKESDIALGFEFALSPDELVTGRRGLSEWFLTTTGQEQHSSAIFQPIVGFGAAFELTRILDNVRKQLSRTPGLTINPGILLGGSRVSGDIEQGTGSVQGRKTIIASQARAHGDMRFLSTPQRDKAERVFFKIVHDKLPGTTAHLEFRPIIPVMPSTEPNHQLLRQYSEVSKRLNGPDLRSVSPAKRGGADISYIAQYVEASLDGLGPWGKGAHTHQETLVVDSLILVTKRAALFLLKQIKNETIPSLHNH